MSNEKTVNQMYSGSTQRERADLLKGTYYAHFQVQALKLKKYIFLIPSVSMASLLTFNS